MRDMIEITRGSMFCGLDNSEAREILHDTAVA